MRRSNKVLFDTAMAIEPYLHDAKVNKGQLDDWDIRNAIIAARRDGIRIPNIGAGMHLTPPDVPKSLSQIESYIVEGCM